MINPSIRVLTRRVVSGQRRYVSDWNSMAELFMEPPAKAKPIRRNNSSTASGSNTTPPLPELALQTLPLPTKTSSGPVPLSKAFPTSLLNDLPAASESTTTNNNHINWSDSFHGLGSVSFEPRIQEILLEPIDSEDIEITPDGLLYLPEIKYRRVLNRAFGAGGWGLAPRSETMIQKNGLTGTLTREYLLICQGRLIAIARGEQDFFNDKGIPTLSEGCKSNALMRCCKDLGIASELWDPKFIRKFKKQNCEEVFVEHVVNKRKKKIWKRKDGFVEYPFKKT